MYIKLLKDFDLKTELSKHGWLKAVEIKSSGMSFFEVDQTFLLLAAQNQDQKLAKDEPGHYGEDVCLCAPAPNIVLVSNKISYLKAVVERKGKPTLSEVTRKALGKVDLAKSVVIILNAKEMNLGKAAGIDAKNLETVAIQFEIAADARFEFAMNCVDEKTAEEVRKKTEERYAQVKPVVALVAGSTGMEVADSVKFANQGSSVVASFTITAEQLKKLTPAMNELRKANEARERKSRR
jgi:hypothetical protein